MPTNAHPTPYEILGVASGATPDDINAAYKKLARQHHPDRYVNKSHAEIDAAVETMKQINEAHETLSDPEKRRAYDLYGDASAAASDAEAQAVFEQMMGMGAGGVAKKRRIVGGALFVDPSRGNFFQRSFDPDDIEKMRDEMTQGLPEVTDDSAHGARVRASTSLPSGSWEVRLVEVDSEAGTVEVTLHAADDAPVDDASERRQPPLRLERTFVLDKTADVTAADVMIDVDGRLAVTAPKKHAMVTHAGAVAPPVGGNEAVAAAAESTAEKPMVADAAPPAAPPPRASRPRRRSKSSLKSGFLNHSKPRRAPPTPEDVSTPRPMEVDELVRPVGTAKESRVASPVSVRESIDAAIEAQMDELMHAA